MLSGQGRILENIATKVQETNGLLSELQEILAGWVPIRHLPALVVC
jgi:hypothetical protein